MRRQTRSRVAASRKADSSPDAAQAPVASRDKVPIPSDSTDNIYGVSDRETERQRKKKVATPKAPAVHTSERSVATAGRSTRSRASLASNSMDFEIVLQSSRSRRDAAMRVLDNLTSTTNEAHDNPDMVISPVVEAGRNTQVDASSLLGPRGPIGNFSGLEINDSEIFGHLDSSFDHTLNNDIDESGSTGQHTGARSADTSAFNVSAFRRQPRRRKSSIVGKDDAPIRPSSRGPTTPGLSSNFNLGNFRRRARQPSILLSSAQKDSLSVQRPGAASEASENAVESEGEGESFLPEAEGTPVRPSRTNNAKSVIESTEGGTRSRKRKSTGNHEAEVAKRRAVDSDEEPVNQSIEMDDRSSPPSILSRTPELDDSVLAPPASSNSSEAGSPVMWPTLNTLGRRPRGRPRARDTLTPALEEDLSDISEPPSLTHSPNLKAAKVVHKSKGKGPIQNESPKLSTADLAALLPRRRRRARRSGDGSENEESASEEDIYDQPRVQSKRKTRPVPGPSSTANQAGHAGPTTAPAKRTTRRTYGSRRFEKENATDGDSIAVAEDASTPLDDTLFDGAETKSAPGNLGEELQAASKKFEEVDKWELDYEEVVESSSPLPEGR